MDRTIDALINFTDKYKGFHQLFNMPWVLPELQTIADQSKNQMVAEVQKNYSWESTPPDGRDDASGSANVNLYGAGRIASH